VLSLRRQHTCQRDLGLSEQLEAFGQRLMPLLAEMGIDPGEPELLEIHNIVRR
jgi:hypothetical protein